MSIEREQYLRLINKIYSNLSAKTFSINYWEKLRAIPREISLLHQLEQLSIYKNKSIKIYPPELADLPNLRHLSLRYNYLKRLPSIIGQLQHLETLNLSNNRFLASSKWEALEQLAQLKSLNLNYALQNFKTLPAALGNLQGLVELHLTGNQLRYLPNSMSQLQQLERLYCDANDFDYFPTVITALPRLKYLQISARALHDLPYDILSLQHIEEVKFMAKSQKNTPYIFAFERLLKTIRMHNIPAAQQRFYLEIIRGDHHISDLDQNALLQLLNSNIPTYINQALNELETRLCQGPLAAQRLPKTGDKLIVRGKLNGKISELKHRLQEQGIQTGVKLTNQTTHILVGSMPGDLQPVLEQGLLLLTEQQLIAHLNQVQKPYLLDTNRAEGVEQVRALLHSEQLENILLGLQFIKSGGFPQELLTELFLIYKFNKNQKIKRCIYEIVGQYAPLDFVTALKSRKSIGSSVSELTRCHNLEYYCQMGNLDRRYIAFYLLQKGRYGHLFALFNLQTTDKQAYFSKVIDRGHLSLASLELAHLPDDFGSLPNLTHLDISYNKFVEVPTPLFDCPHLKVLYIRGLYELHKAPQALWNIPHLETIYVGYNNRWLGNTPAKSLVIDGKHIIGR